MQSNSPTFTPLAGGLGATSPLGFVTPAQPLPVDLSRPCVDCGSGPSAVATFTGVGVCRTCDRRRERVAVLLAGVVRGAIPEELATGRAVTISDDLERAELRDHVDVLLAAHREPLAVAA